jgi:tyrosyl-DNA phosphodiesterase-1
VDHDWRDIENTVWVQDISRRPSPIPHEPKLDDFTSTLEGVLGAVNVEPALISLVSTGVRRSYVWLRPSAIDMVYSSTPTSLSVLFVPVHYAPAGTSLMYT